MSNSVDAQKSLGLLVTEQPSRARVFERMGLDYCCGGKQSLAAACEEKGLDVKSVVETLSAFESLQHESKGVDGTDWSQESPTHLCDHIEQTHHTYLREELPRLASLVDKVSRVHGGTQPNLHQVRETFGALSRELMSHMQKEEQILFPVIRRLDSGAPPANLGSVEAPIRRMESEHDSAGNGLETIRELTDDYAIPQGACNSYRAMLSALEELEQDLHQHIHKENNILFPRAISIEKELAR